MSSQPSRQYAATDLSLGTKSWREGGLGTHERDLLELGLIAKAVCSGIFVSGRPLEILLEREIKPYLGDRQVEIDVDLKLKCVNVSVDETLHRQAVFVGGQGAVLLAIGTEKIFFNPSNTQVGNKQENASIINCRDTPSSDLASGWDASLLKQAELAAFKSEPDPMTTALIVAHKGQLVLECYGGGANKSTQLQSWSMGKTLTAMLIGHLIQMGELELHQPAPIRQWQHDQRSEITIANLLQMSSGLNFTASWASDYVADSGYPDHSLMYTAGIDVFQFALSRELAHAPSTFAAYKNGDTLVLGHLVKQTVEALGIKYFDWPQQALFAPLGIDKLTLETDPYGNFITTGNNFGTARDWARLGQLLLQRGRVGGQQVIPESFVEFMQQPAPAWRGQYWTEPGPAGWQDSIYGGQVWLNRYPAQDRWPLPKDAFFMLGMGGQYTFIIPSMDLVIVRLGDQLGTPNSGRGCMPSVLDNIVNAFKSAGPTE